MQSEDIPEFSVEKLNKFLGVFFFKKKEKGNKNRIDFKNSVTKEGILSDFLHH